MKHIRYLSDSVPICEKPEGLGLDLVVADKGTVQHPSCRYCSALLLDYNKSSYEAELIGMHNSKQNKVEVTDVRWLWLSAISFTSAFWIGFFLVLKWLLYG